jgi:hypothetical protein
MDKSTLRLLIQEKLTDGRLPRERLPRMWGGQGAGETCDACGETVTRAQKGMEILDATGAGCSSTSHASWCGRSSGNA